MGGGASGRALFVCLSCASGKGVLGGAIFYLFCVITASVNAVFGANLCHAQMGLWLGLRLWLRGGGKGWVRHI